MLVKLVIIVQVSYRKPGSKLIYGKNCQLIKLLTGTKVTCKVVVYYGETGSNSQRVKCKIVWYIRTGGKVVHG